MARWGCFANGKEALPLLGVAACLSRRPVASVVVVDLSDWSPLVVNEASHGSGGEEVKTPCLPRTISIMGPEQPLWFCLSSINNEVFNRSSCSLGLQQVLGESRPFSSLILKLTLLRCL
jgi:hypothetical protein